MNKCFSCGQPISAGQVYCPECSWNPGSKTEAWPPSPKNSQSDPFSADYESNSWQSVDQQHGARGRSNTNLRRGLTIGVAALAGLVLVSGVVGGISSLLFGETADQNSSPRVDSPQTVEPEQSLEAVYFGPGIVPLFTGRTAESAAIVMRDQVEERFDQIQNLDTNSKLTTFFDDERDLRDLRGLFVCSQSISPGADVAEFAFGYIDIEVSASCSNQEVPFAMGPAAELLGRFIPAGFNSECHRIDTCDLNEIDGVLIKFLDEGYLGHKRALVLTGLGETEVELAMIDITTEWCDANASEGGTLWGAALDERDSLLPVGSIIRMRGADDLYGDRRLVHRVSTDGRLVDGEPPVNSVNELLVATGFWVPDDNAGEHPWENVSYFQDDFVEPTWIAKERHSDSDQIVIYRDRIISAANNSFASPNILLATCLDEKQDSVVILIAEEEREEEENRRLEQERLDRQAELDESGGGSNCTWVNAHYRGNSYVRGHWRCR